MEVVICVPGGHEQGVVVTDASGVEKPVGIGDTVYFEIVEGETLTVKVGKKPDVVAAE